MHTCSSLFRGTYYVLSHSLSNLPHPLPSSPHHSAWKYMNWYDRLRGVRDLAVLGVIPVPHSRWLLGLPQLSIGRQSDAAAEVRD